MPLLQVRFHVKNVVPHEGETVGQRLFTDLAENGLLIAPGEMFSAEGAPIEDPVFRIAFSMGTVCIMPSDLRRT